MKIKAIRFVMIVILLVIATGFNIPVGRWESTFAAPSAAFPLGDYSTFVFANDTVASVRQDLVGPNAGPWEMTFAAGGRYTVTKNAAPIVQGEFATTESQITVGKETGPRANICGAESGTYNWAFDGKMLTLTKVVDGCIPRVVVFTAHPWTKREALAQVPDDKLIVPGQRIGRWTLTMTIADLTQMNGAPNQVVPGGGQDRNREVLMHVWDRLGFVAVTNTSDRQRPEVLAATSDEFKTERGIGVNSRRETVEAAYPRPTAETSVRDEVRRLIYDEIGLGVLTFVSGGLVQSVLVFRPGTAKQLWKF